MTESTTSSQVVTCPECGSVAMVAVNRRDSADFCRNCDFPLFWVPSVVILDRRGGPEESLRRLPGTVGRATIASLTCPHCAEPNALTATLCVRCGLSLHPVEAPPPPPPEPVYVALPPPPEPVEVPPREVPWWVWALVALALGGAVALITVIMLKTLS